MLHTDNYKNQKQGALETIVVQLLISEGEVFQPPLLPKLNASDFKLPSVILAL